MLIRLPPSLQKLHGKRHDLQLVLALLGGNADGVVDAIDGFRLNLARHERLAQLELLAAPFFSLSWRSSSIFAISASEEISFRSWGVRDQPLLCSSVATFAIGARMLRQCFELLAAWARTARTAPDELRARRLRGSRSAALRRGLRSRPSGPLPRSLRSPTTSIIRRRLPVMREASSGSLREHGGNCLHGAALIEQQHEELLAQELLEARQA